MSDDEKRSLELRSHEALLRKFSAEADKAEIDRERAREELMKATAERRTAEHIERYAKKQADAGVLPKVNVS